MVALPGQVCSTLGAVAATFSTVCAYNSAKTVHTLYKGSESEESAKSSTFQKGLLAVLKPSLHKASFVARHAAEAAMWGAFSVAGAALTALALDTEGKYAFTRGAHTFVKIERGPDFTFDDIQSTFRANVPEEARAWMPTPEEVKESVVNAGLNAYESFSNLLSPLFTRSPSFTAKPVGFMSYQMQRVGGLVKQNLIPLGVLLNSAGLTFLVKGQYVHSNLLGEMLHHLKDISKKSTETASGMNVLKDMLQKLKQSPLSRPITPNGFVQASLPGSDSGSDASWVQVPVG